MNTPASEQLQRQQMMALLNQQSQPDLRIPPGATPGYFALDPSSAAKQMAALTATAQNRRASQSGGTSDTLFGPRQLDSVSDVNASGQANRGPAISPQVSKSQRDEFLKFLTRVMNARNTPLPATITGIPSAYDPNTSRWKTIEPAAEPGGFRLAGKDVDLFKLWQIVLSQGGNAKMTREAGWNAVRVHFGLPEEHPDPANGTTPMARVLAHYYMALLAPFEEVYVRNIQQQQQQKAMQARHQQLQQGHAASPMPDSISVGPSSQPSQSPMHGFPTSTPMPPTQLSSTSGSVEPENHTMTLDPAMLGQHRPPTAPIPHSSTPVQSSDMLHGISSGEPRDRSEPVGSPGLPHGSSEDDSRKRKFIEEEAGKRVRQKTESSGTAQETGAIQDEQHGGSQTQSPSRVASQAQLPSTSTSNANTSRQSHMRRKIEYVPLARDVDSYGGRDLAIIDAEFGKVAARRPQRSIDEWGTVDIDGLTMSLRSRIPTEISYALTVLTVLSTMRGQTPDSGFSLHQCEDLLDELLDLLREQAFGDEDDVPVDSETFWTHRELVAMVQDHGLHTFSDLPRTNHRASADDDLRPPPANTVSGILNLFRNLSLTSDNPRFIVQHPEAMALLLRVCSLSTPAEDTTGRPPSPSSPVLSLSEVVKARRDVLTIISSLVPHINLASYAPPILRRLFELLASFLVEPHEISSPSGIFIQNGSNATSVHPPLVVDLALEAFTKLIQPDANRLVLSRGIKLTWLWSLFCSLVHRLPVSAEDFAITVRMHDIWLSYLEKVVLSIYSICFLASPELKTKIRTDRSLAFSKLIFRMVKKFVGISQPDTRQFFLVSSRRAVEALKLIDEGNDAFESKQSTAPQLAFGMGYGESDAKQAETGIGLLAGFREDITWSIMLMPHLDDVMFAELDSLSRIGV